MKVGLAQLNSQEDREANLKAASEAVMRLADDGCDLVALPEYVGFLNTDRGLMQAHAVNARRGDEGTRVADWDDAVWLSFDPAAALVLVQ